MNKYEGPYCQPKWSKPTAASISVDDHIKLWANTQKQLPGRRLGGEPKSWKIYRDKFFAIFLCLPTLTQVIPTGFWFFFFFVVLFLLFFLPGLHQGQPKSWTCNVITITQHQNPLGEKSMFLAKVTQIKGSLWYKKSGEMTFMFLPLSLPLYSHHLVLRVAPVIHNYGI